MELGWVEGRQGEGERDPCSFFNFVTTELAGHLEDRMLSADEDFYEQHGFYDWRTFQNDPPAHVYHMGARVYRAMRENGTNQVVLECGESGAGKTETAKHLVKHFMCMCPDEVGDLHQRIVEINPLLEAFGNAKTIMNDNSSRFAKYLEISFRSDGQVLGAVVRDYMLEKSRVVLRGKNEGNFHIFYSLFAGASKAKLSELGLQNPETYRVLQSCKDLIRDTSHYKEMYDHQMTVLRKIGLSEDEIDIVHCLLGAVLNITQIEFEEMDRSTEELNIRNTELLRIAADALSLDWEKLGHALIASTIVTGGETIKSFKSLSQAEDGRDALAKTIYERTFGFIARKINENLNPSKSRMLKAADIGILDIAGFEKLQLNSFEQMSINVTNEILQYLMNETVIVSEKRVYQEEGIPLGDIRFENNNDINDLFNAGIAKMVFRDWEDRMLSADEDCRKGPTDRVTVCYEDLMFPADEDFRKGPTERVIWRWEYVVFPADDDCPEMITLLVQQILRTLLIEYEYTELAWIQKWIITIMITILAFLSKSQLRIKVRFKHGKNIKATKLVLLVCGDIERNPGPGNSRSEILRKFRKSQQTRILKMLHGLKGSKEPMHLYKKKPEWWPTDAPFVNVSNHRKENECKECFDTLVDLLLCHQSTIPFDLVSVLNCFKDLNNSDCKNKQARENRTREVECKEALVAWMDIKNTEKVLCTTTTPFYDNLRGLLCILKEREKQGEPIPEDIIERCREIASTKSEVLEDNRLSHKDSRLSHKNNRLSLEDSRLSHEDSSLWHEESRLLHEDSRLSHESSRFSHEDSRFLHQNSRLTHKNSRLSHEESRFSHGDSRLSSGDIHLSGNNMGKRKHSFKDTEFAASKKPKIESIDIGKMTGSRFPLQEQDILVHEVPMTSPVESSSFEENKEYTKISPDSDNLKDVHVSDILPDASAIPLFMDLLDFNQTEGMVLSIQTEEGLPVDSDALPDSFTTSGDSAAEQTPVQENDYDL